MNLCQFHRILQNIDDVLALFRARGFECEVFEVLIKEVPDCDGRCRDRSVGGNGL